MILVDQALARRAAQNRPIRAGVIGAGTLGTAIVHQVMRHAPGITIAALFNRHPEKARGAFEQAGASHAVEVFSVGHLEDNLRKGIPSFTSQADLLCVAEGIDVILEVTGTIEFASSVCLQAFSHGKPVILVNAELEATLGPILKHYAARAGVILSGSDGDQPGVIMNLYRFVRGMGITPVLCGNIKGLQDPYRTPATQAEFARIWDQNARMVTSFADGTKISFEQAAVANATGMTVAQRGMIGREFKGHIDELRHQYDAEELRQLGGVVDYVVGAQPGPGVFLYGVTDDPFVQKNLKLYKLGDGPLYSFYTPYHLCFLEIPSSIARVVEFQEAVMAPIGGPSVEVITLAKRDLLAGEELDGIGGYTLYGQAEKHSIARAEDLLPVGLAEGCKLRREIARDSAITFAEVILPADRLCDRLWREQLAMFDTSSTTAPKAEAVTSGT
jgi:predicted homoserine dehydrogenase-like protein